MQPKVAILLADGFEEAEAIMIFNALYRLKIDVEFISCEDNLNVVSYHHVMITAHQLLNKVLDKPYDAIILPGGPDGTVNLANNINVMNFITQHDNEGKWLCPICSAAVKVLGKHNLLKGRKYTCSGDLYTMPNDGIYLDQDIVIDRNLLSGKGLGYAFKFAFVLAEKLHIERRKIHTTAEHIYLSYDENIFEGV